MNHRQNFIIEKVTGIIKAVGRDTDLIRDRIYNGSMQIYREKLAEDGKEYTPIEVEQMRDVALHMLEVIDYYSDKFDQEVEDMMTNPERQF